jgi:hypothetical protein
MPERTTEIIVQISDADKSRLQHLASLAEKAGAQGPVEIEGNDDGSGIVRAQFPIPDHAFRFVERARGSGVQIGQHLTRDAVLSWLGHYGRVTTRGLHRTGEITQLDKDTIRIVPRATLGGIDIEPSTFGSERAGDAHIDDIIDITPARPGDVY